MEHKKKRISPFSIIVITIVLFAIVSAAFLFAAYKKDTVEVNNMFKPADSIIPGIVEEFEENDRLVKENVYFTVEENKEEKTEYPVYFRVAIVITWQDENGVVYYEPPVPPVDENGNENENPDYYIALNTDDWTLKDDGFYYFKDPVESGGKTSVLIEKCYQINPAPAEGYTLSVELIVQTIQAIGYTDGEDNTDDENDTDKIPAWEDAAWKVS